MPNVLIIKLNEFIVSDPLKKSISEILTHTVMVALFILKC